jgi:hypothetical protein
MFSFIIVPDADGVERFELTAGMRDIRMWEKTRRGRSLGQMNDPSKASATVLFEIAHTAASRQGLVPSGLTDDEFAERYDIEMLDDEEDSAEAEDPTPPAA